MLVVTHDGATAAALPRTITIRGGQVGAEGRRGQQFVVVNGDGTVALPPDVLAEHPPGSLFSIRRRADGVELPARATMTAAEAASGVSQLSAVDVTVSVGPRRLLSEVNLVVRAGETVGVSGLSGSGKTTLLHVLAGLLPGLRLRRRRRPALLPVHDHRVGLVPQTLGLVPTLTAHETVALPRQAAGMERPTLASVVQPVLQHLGLEPIADHLVGNLSGGQRQRVAIAHALAGDPDIVLVDEPGAALDEAWRNVVLALLADHAGRGAIVVIASHDDDVMGACDRTVTLEDGRLVPVTS